MLAPVTSTFVPIGSDWLVHPSVSVAAPVPEQWAAWPTYTVEPLVKMKFDVHWAPSVNVCTPGWMAAVAAGAHADAAGASTSAASRGARDAQLELLHVLTLPRVRSRICVSLPPQASD